MLQCCVGKVMPPKGMRVSCGVCPCLGRDFFFVSSPCMLRGMIGIQWKYCSLRCRGTAPRIGSPPSTPRVRPVGACNNGGQRHRISAANFEILDGNVSWRRRVPGGGGGGRRRGLSWSGTVKNMPCMTGRWHVVPRAYRDDVGQYNNQYEEEQSGEDFYSILGLHPTATKTDIKQAYRQMMKDFHPDQSDDDETNEFAVFLNFIYEVLMDDDARAEYNVIAGFTLAEANPFSVVNPAYPLEFTFVDEFTCIGCRNCTNVAPKTFMIEEEFGRARVFNQNGSNEALVDEAIDTCPVNCIHKVNAPQLSLLEQAMAVMERVDAWLMMTGGGKGKHLNVFYEAQLQWAKRQSQLKDKENASRWRWTPAGGSASWTDASSSYDDGAWQARARSVPKNAASFVQAARKWRDFSRARARKRQMLLDASITLGETSTTVVDL